MAQQLVTINGDRRLVLANGEAIRQPSYMSGETEITGSASSATDLITATAHGVALNDKIMILGATPPGGLTSGAIYFARDISANTFGLSTSAGGSLIDLSSNGTTWTWVKLNWYSVRVGLRGSMYGASASITGTPTLAMGVCRGNTAGYGAAASTFVAGARFQVATWTYNAGTGGNSYYSDLASPSNSVFRRVGALVTSAASFSGTGFFSASNNYRSGLFFEFTRAGTGNVECHVYGNTTTLNTNDLTDAEFQAIMELTSIGDIATVKSNYAIMLSRMSALGANEYTNGLLNHLFIYWSRSTPGFSFDIKHRLVSA